MQPWLRRTEGRGGAGFGATDVIHAGKEDPAAAIHRLVGGADYAFEAAGQERTIQQAWSSLDVGGEAVVVGLMPHGATVTLNAGGFISEQVIRGCYFGSAHLQHDVPVLVGHYLAGNLLLDELITRRIGLDELNDAFGALRAGKGPAASWSSTDPPVSAGAGPVLAGRRRPAEHISGYRVTRSGPGRSCA